MNLHLHPLLLCLSSIAISSLPLLLFLDVCTHVCLSVCVCLCLSGYVWCVRTYVCLWTYLHSPPTLVIINNPTLFEGSSDNVAPRWACMVLSWARLTTVSCEGWGSKCFRFHRPSRPCCNHSWQPESSHSKVQTSWGSYFGTGICHLWSRWRVISSPVINFPSS